MYCRCIQHCNTLGISGLCFELPEDSATEDESLEETRYAELSEVLHINHVAYYEWEKLWQGSRRFLRGTELDLFRVARL